MVDGFWSQPTARLVDFMRANGNQTGIVEQWKRTLENWANVNDTPDAKALKAWLPQFSVRPFYTARELCPMMPALQMMFGASGMILPQKSTARLANELDAANLPLLQNAKGLVEFTHPVIGGRDRFYIVERLHYWSQRELTQAEFEREFFYHDRKET